MTKTQLKQLQAMLDGPVYAVTNGKGGVDLYGSKVRGLKRATLYALLRAGLIKVKSQEMVEHVTVAPFGSTAWGWRQNHYREDTYTITPEGRKALDFILRRTS